MSEYVKDFKMLMGLYKQTNQRLDTMQKDIDRVEKWLAFIESSWEQGIEKVGYKIVRAE